MKLNPPASSSDLEAAREIARRLHRRRRRDDLGVPETPTAPPAPPAPRRRPTPALTPALEAPPLRRPVPAFDAAPEPAPPPSWDEPVGEPSTPDGVLDTLADFGEPAAAAETREPDDLGLPDVDVEVTGVSPEEMIGLAEPEAPPEPEPETEAEAAPALEDLGEPEPPAPPSPFEIDLDDEGVSAAEDDLVGGAAVPSWDDIADSCLELSQAGATMIVDPAGQVFAARGEWPAPGPEAIAVRLVATMSRTLKDAPTRSISAPLGARYLTAWRVPLTEGLVTVAFLSDAPVRAETRPTIDTEIHRGAGA
jgi:hypothetical protein